MLRVPQKHRVQAMKVKILEYKSNDAFRWKRYTSGTVVRGYDDLTELWVLTNYVRDDLLVEIDGRQYRIKREAMPGLVTDKASTPGSSSDWYAARRAYVWHDVDFSCHYLRQFAEYQDGGFRATNLMFEADIDWHVRKAKRIGVISGFRKFLWMMKKRAWYRAVDSIVGQGRYVNGRASRGNHGKYSKCTIMEL